MAEQMLHHCLRLALCLCIIQNIPFFYDLLSRANSQGRSDYACKYYNCFSAGQIVIHTEYYCSISVYDASTIARSNISCNKLVHFIFANATKVCRLLDRDELI